MILLSKTKFRIRFLLTPTPFQISELPYPIRETEIMPAALSKRLRLQHLRLLQLRPQRLLNRRNKAKYV
jgi:hypothetical protein